MNIILLSGGSGKRLWPLSNDIRSKQFLQIFRKEDGTRESMVQRMVRGLRDADPSIRITFATSVQQVSSLKAQLGDDVDISVEPARRDTFPAIALACAYLKDVRGVRGDDTVVVCPVDPYVEQDYFEALKELDAFAKKGDANLCVMGMEPTYPSAKYGYVLPAQGESGGDGVETGEVFRVGTFREKPDEETAAVYIRQGALWNGGVFAFRPDYVLEKARALTGYDTYEALRDNYESLERISFDYAVCEQETRILALRFHGTWKDLGTWNTLSEAMEETALGEAVLADTCENVHVINDLDMPVLCMGLKDTVVAASPDGILVSDKHQSSYIKPYVEQIEEMSQRRKDAGDGKEDGGRKKEGRALSRLLLRAAVVLGVLNLCYLVFMTLVFALPLGARVRGNAAESLRTWREGTETEAPLFHDNRIFWNDTSSEILLVNCAVTEAGSVLQRGAALFYTRVPETGDIPPVQSYRNLEAALSGEAAAGTTTETYERYWYLLAGVFRLLFSFLTIGEIRWLLYAGGSLLALWLFIRVHTLLGVRGVIPLALAFVSRTLMLNTATAMTAMDVYTLCAAMVALTYLYRKPWFFENRILFYLVTGSVTFAIGPFIAPLLTLGMTLVLDLQLTGENDRNKSAWMRLFSCSAAWAAGYVLTMICKMAVSRIAVGNAEAAGVAAGYLGAGTGTGLAARFAVLGSCLYRLCMPSQATVVALLVFVAIWIADLKKKGIRKPQNAALLAFVALYPVFWVLVVSEHSRHDYAVNIFAVTVYALAVICAGFVRKAGKEGKQTNGIC